MQLDEILDLADKAARCTLRGRPIWTREDWQDATQEAAIAIWELRHQPEGYVFLAAKSAIYSWLRVWLRHPRGGSLLDYLDYADEKNTPRSLDWLGSLAPHLHKQGSMKADEELRYLELRLLGFSTEGIAREMKLSRRNVYAIRERLLPRLERIARDEWPISRGDAIRRGRAKAQST